MPSIQLLIIFNLAVLAILILGLFWYYGRLKFKIAKEARELSVCEQKKGTFYETISGLTAISGVTATLDYIAENLQKTGFSKILIFLIDKKAQTLNPKIILGFKDFDFENLKIKIKPDGGLISRTFYKNKSYIADQRSPDLSNDFELKKFFNPGSFITAPIARKSSDRCWEIFHCGQAQCPAYENNDSRCWALPQTRCYLHHPINYDQKIYDRPETRLEACLNCERFQVLGVIIAVREELGEFSDDEKKLFRALAYQAGSKLERAFLLSHLEERERELTRRMYEISILKELGERIGYSLNTQKIADIIIGSLKKIIDFSSASYLLIDPDQEKLLFKCQLEEPVSRSFVTAVKERTLAGLSALVNAEFKIEAIDESLTGTVLVENLVTPIRSFFNIPLTLGDRVVGMLNVASTRPGLYREEEMTILYKITAQASNAVTKLHSVLAAEQDKLNSMVSSMADGVLMVDKENHLYVLNPQAKKMLGLSQKDVSLFDVFNIFADKFDFRTKLEECLRLDRLVVTDEVYLNKYFFRILFSPVKNNNNEILGAVTIFHDITHDKEIEKMRDDFTSMMVHDLRSPLNGIRLMSELIQKKEIAPEIKNSIALIHESASKMLEQVNDLLDIAKIEAGKFVVDKKLDNLAELVYNRIDFFRPMSQDKNINLTAQLAKNLALFKFDRQEIEQVFNNLISNALKYTDAGGNVIVQALPYGSAVSLEEQALKFGLSWFLNSKNPVFLAWRQPGIICAVTDTGCGIAEADLSRLFNKFEQAENAYRSKTKSTGLGLVIAKGIVEAHGGVVGVESKLDKGSTFFFILPLE